MSDPKEITLQDLHEQIGLTPLQLAAEGWQLVPCDALYSAWTVIANAWGGDWGSAPSEWREAAERWRDEVFHPSLDPVSER